MNPCMILPYDEEYPQYLEERLRPPLCLPVGIEVDPNARVMEPYGRFFCYKFRTVSGPITRWPCLSFFIHCVGFCAKQFQGIGVDAAVFDFNWDAYFEQRNCRCVTGFVGGRCRLCTCVVVDASYA